MADDKMSDEDLDEIYRRMVDGYIDRANEFAESESKENVGMALLYAASRFNAFVVSQHAETLVDYERDLLKASEFFKVQYAQMLDENLEDYKKIYASSAHLINKQ